MKHADKVIDLMAAFPGREFRMLHIVRYVCPNPKSQRERSSVREAVRVALGSLIDCGVVICRPSAHKRGGYAVYRWR
jgi:hypothetical protein